MLMPSIFHNNNNRLFDDFFNFPSVDFSSWNGFSNGDLLKTDVKEKDDSYELSLSVPGVAKDDIKAELKDGYLIVTASVHQNNDEKNADGKYIRRERTYGTATRSFYVGEAVKQEDIKAKIENGVLELCVPKKEPEAPAVEEKKYIAIEG